MMSASLPRILIIDDVSRDGGAWADALRRAGFCMSIAASADDGLHALDGFYDLLIVSVGKSVTVELDLIRKVSVLVTHPCCILVAENAGSGFLKEVRFPDAWVLLEKPVSISKIIASVRKLMLTRNHAGVAAIS